MKIYRRIVSKIHDSTSYISIQDVKDHLRTVNTDEDGYLSAILDAAFDMVENHLTYPVRLHRVQFTSYSWPLNGFTLPGKFHALESIKYYAENTNELTPLDTASYAYQLRSHALAVMYIDDASLPDTYEDRLDGVQVNTQMGWVPGDMPSAIRAAVLLNIGDLYEERKNTTAGTLGTLARGTEFLLNPYLIPEFV